MAGAVREVIHLECTECKHRNYSNTKNKRTHSAKMETKKFCPFCRKHVNHKESK